MVLRKHVQHGGRLSLPAFSSPVAQADSFHEPADHGCRAGASVFSRREPSWFLRPSSRDSFFCPFGHPDPLCASDGKAEDTGRTSGLFPSFMIGMSRGLQIRGLELFEQADALFVGCLGTARGGDHVHVLSEGVNVLYRTSPHTGICGHFSDSPFGIFGCDRPGYSRHGHHVRHRDPCGRRAVWP